MNFDNVDWSSERIEKDADALIKGLLRLDSQWWKVRFMDFKKKYNIQSGFSWIDPPVIHFRIPSGEFHYLGLQDLGFFVLTESSDNETPDAEALMKDFEDAGITDEGHVKYKFSFE